ncbi:MAG: YhcH/YjgK/YiaL family protein [Verrucomicrobiota bacterium JB024]|nr:YhcH/YjgK/YiaL family protein [Verrucomicrobiota bacterium JB024]
MIHTELSLAGRYVPVHPLFGEMVEYLKTISPDTALGRYEIGNRGSYALVQRYETVDSSERQLEGHRRYADAHYIMAGSERLVIGTGVPSHEPLGSYDEDKDIQFFADSSRDWSCGLSAGELLVLFPEDLHKPGCHHRGCGEGVMKIVVKIPMVI